MVTLRIWFTAAQKAELWSDGRTGKVLRPSRGRWKGRKVILLPKATRVFARPGGNMTGMFLDLPELSGKQWRS